MSAEFQLIHLRDFEPVSAECLQSLPESLIRRQMIVPVALRGGRLVAAVPNTQGIVKPEGLQMLAHCPVDLVIAPAEEIIDFIRRHYPDPTAPIKTELTVIHPSPVPAEAPPAVPPAPEPTPITSVPDVSLSSETLLLIGEPAGCPPSLRRLLLEAVGNRARELLVERDGLRLRVRQRIRGVLVTNLREKLSAPEAADIFSYVIDKGAVQNEGGVRWATLDFEVALRDEAHGCHASVSDTSAFSLLTLRLAPMRERAFEPSAWGMGPDQSRVLESLLSRRQGLLLFCGLEGDEVIGTMRACLRPLVTPERQVIAVQGRRDERLSGVEQLLSAGDPDLFMRHLQIAFRHGPDVVLARPLERRDQLELCLSEAAGGRLILAGLPAADVADAIRRVFSMGLEPYQVSNALLGVVAQRSLRLNCPRCQVKDTVDRERLKMLGVPLAMQPTAFFRGRGCDACLGSGFDRETTLFEILEFTDDARGQAQRDPSPGSLRALIHANSLMTLRQIALHKAINGQTSLAEVLRATS